MFFSGPAVVLLDLSPPGYNNLNTSYMLGEKRGERQWEREERATVTVIVTPTKVRYKGVKERPRGKDGDDITNPIQKIHVWLGTYDMKEEAAKTFEKATRMYYYYPKAKLNFPTSNEDNLENPNINKKNLYHELNLELILAPSESK
ncbi:hypothetical protein MTR67_009378 [Solanum verrucosum]|uniref:AP2/ERF domain-containing protein n=1 Tax=Solanum verrucosum TaxID=315347 RepID=A0AAF0Q414_SOLVR|nr:hypothetical protein MTR67_009378 [Solanum verrucosum]